METRVIKLKVGLQEGVVEIATNVRTLSEFKQLPEVAQLNINWSKVKVLDRDTKLSIDLEESLLPSVNCILFIVDTHNKAGLNYKEAKLEVQRLIAEGKLAPINFVGKSTQDLCNLIDSVNPKEAIKENAPEIDSDVNLLANEISLQLASINEKVLKMASLKGTNSEEVTKELEKFKNTLATFITYDEIDMEAEMLKEMFNKRG